jgi:hypothetical protein
MIKVGKKRQSFCFDCIIQILNPHKAFKTFIFRFLLAVNAGKVEEKQNQFH